MSWLGAVQAQEYEATKWAIGLRVPDGTADADIEHRYEQFLSAEVMLTPEPRPRAWPPHTTRWPSIRTLHLKLDEAERGIPHVEKIQEDKRFQHMTKVAWGSSAA